MKAITVNNDGSTFASLTLEMNFPDPKLRSEIDLSINLMAFSINPIDVQMRKGMSELKLLKSSILGRDFAGVVDQVGASVTNFKSGDRVYGYLGSLGTNGSYAQKLVCPSSIIAKIPDHISFEEAASIPVGGATSLQVIERLPNLDKNSSIFITGAAGGVGTILIQLLLNKGVKKIVATYGNEASKNHLLSFGLQLNQLVSYQLNSNIKQEAINKNEGNLFDYAIDLVGNNMAEVAAEVLKIQGTFVDVTFFTTSHSREVLFDKGACVLNIANYVYAFEEKLHSQYARMLNHLNELIGQRKILLPSLNVFAGLTLENIDKAHELIDKNITQGKKIVIKI